MPSHFRTAETSFLSGMFRRMGVITVGPVTIIRPLNKKEICQESPKIKCAAMPAPKNVTRVPRVISLVITGPTFATSERLSVNPPSKRMILMARETK